MRLSFQAILAVFEDVANVSEWRSDPDQYGVAEFWAELQRRSNGKLTGDCEDHSITWLHRLMAAGQPLDWNGATGLRFGLVAVDVRPPLFDHCVLIVACDDGTEYVLDCRHLERPISLKNYPDKLVTWGIGKEDWFTVDY